MQALEEYGTLCLSWETFNHLIHTSIKRQQKICIQNWKKTSSQALQEAEIFEFPTFGTVFKRCIISFFSNLDKIFHTCRLNHNKDITVSFINRIMFISNKYEYFMKTL